MSSDRGFGDRGFSVDKFVNKATKIGKAMYNAATNPDQYQNAPNQQRPPNQPHGDPSNPPSPYQYQAGQQPYQPMSQLQQNMPTSTYQGQTNANPTSVDSYSQSQYGQIAPPAAYGNPAYQGSAAAPQYPMPPASSSTSATPVSYPPNTYTPGVPQSPVPQPHTQWNAPAAPPPQTPVSPPPWSPTPVTTIPNQVPTPVSSVHSIPPPSQINTPGVFSHQATPASYASPHPPGPPPFAGQETGIVANTPNYNAQSQWPTAVPGHLAGTIQGAGSAPSPLNHSQSFPSPITQPAVPQSPHLNHPNSYPQVPPPQGTPSQQPMYAPSPMNTGAMAPPLQPQPPQQDHQAFIAELPAEMPIELPAELPGYMETVHKPMNTVGAQAPSQGYPGQLPPPVNLSSHPNAFSQVTGSNPQAVPPGPTSPQPLHKTSADASIDQLEQPKPVHPEHTPAATAQTIASITPVSPPPGQGTSQYAQAYSQTGSYSAPLPGPPQGPPPGPPPTHAYPGMPHPYASHQPAQQPAGAPPGQPAMMNYNPLANSAPPMQHLYPHQPHYHPGIHQQPPGPPPGHP